MRRRSRFAHEAQSRSESFQIRRAVSIACVESEDVVGERISAFLDSGKDSGQKLTDLFISRYFTTVLIPKCCSKLQGLGCAIGVEGIVTKAFKFLISEAVFGRHSALRKRLGCGAEMEIDFIDI